MQAINSKISGREAIIACSLFVLALLLRLHFKNAGLFFTDSVIAAQSVEATYKTGILHYMHGVGYPGHVLTGLFFFAVGKLFFNTLTAEQPVLFATILCAALSVAVYYLLVRKVSKSEIVAASAALILNSLPVFLSTSTYGMNHQIAGFFFLAAFYLAFSGGASGRWFLLTLASLSFGWAVSVRIDSLQLAPLFLFFYILGAKEGGSPFPSKIRLARDLVILALPGAALLLLAYLPMMTANGLSPVLSGLKYNRWLGIWHSQITYPILTTLTISVSWLGWLLCAAGFASLIREKEWWRLGLLGMWCAYLIMFANIATAEDRHSIPALMGFAAVMGYGIKLVSARINRWAAIGAVAALLLMMSIRIFPLLEERAKFFGQKQFALSVKKLVPADSVVIAMDEAPHLQYYGGLRTMDHPQGGDSEDIRRNIAALSELLAKGTKLFVVQTAFLYDEVRDIGAQPQENGLSRIYDTRTGQWYDGVLMDVRRNAVTTGTGVTLPLFGKWQVAFLSAFEVTPIGQFGNEDWHRRNVLPGKMREMVYAVRLRPKGGGPTSLSSLPAVPTSHRTPSAG